MDTTTAWHGSADLKAEVMARLRAHRAADEIVQGVYQINDDYGYRGCAIGCTLPELSEDECRELDAGDMYSWHRRVEREYGIPWIIAWRIDQTFELFFDHKEAGKFAVDVIDAIPVGADLSSVFKQFPHLDETIEDYAAWLIDALANAPIPAGTP